MRRRRKNVTIIHNEIDYDKLAEAIVRANATKQEVEEAPKEKISVKEFWKTVGMIITNKKASNGQLAAGLLGVLMSLLFNGFAVMTVLFLIAEIYTMTTTVSAFVWTLQTAMDNVFTMVFWLLLFVFTAVLAIYFRGVANEIAAEKDRNYIVAVFAGLTSFAALIVAFISLFKGCGNG